MTNFKKRINSGKTKTLINLIKVRVSCVIIVLFGSNFVLIYKYKNNSLRFNTDRNAEGGLDLVHELSDDTYSFSRKKKNLPHNS